MQAKDVEFCTFREIRAAIVTWNAGASTPGSVKASTFIQDAIHPDNPPEILVFGFQELVDLENKKITASMYPSLDFLATLTDRRELAHEQQEEGERRKRAYEPSVPGLDGISDTIYQRVHASGRVLCPFA